MRWGVFCLFFVLLLFFFLTSTQNKNPYKQKNPHLVDKRWQGSFCASAWFEVRKKYPLRKPRLELFGVWNFCICRVMEPSNQEINIKFDFWSPSNFLIYSESKYHYPFFILHEFAFFTKIGSCCLSFFILFFFIQCPINIF